MSRKATLLVGSTIATPVPRIWPPPISNTKRHHCPTVPHPATSVQFCCSEIEQASWVWLGRPQSQLAYCCRKRCFRSVGVPQISVLRVDLSRRLLAMLPKGSTAAFLRRRSTLLCPSPVGVLPQSQPRRRHWRQRSAKTYCKRRAKLKATGQMEEIERDFAPACPRPQGARARRGAVRYESDRRGG
jgi:hypothetical protein